MMDVLLEKRGKSQSLLNKPVIEEEEVQVENDGSKNPTSKSPQTGVEVAIEKTENGGFIL